MNVTIDAADVIAVFRALPSASISTLMRLIESSAIDVQRDMRTGANVGVTGDLRRSIKYKIDRANLSAEIFPDVPYAEDVENGTRPHWASVKEGSSLRKWADAHNINPYALQKSIALKGTKAHPFVGPAYKRAMNSVPTAIERGFAAFISGVNNGRV